MRSWGQTFFSSINRGVGFKRGGKVEESQKGHRSRLGWLVDGSRVANRALFASWCMLKYIGLMEAHVIIHDVLSMLIVNL